MRCQIVESANESGIVVIERVDTGAQKLIKEIDLLSDIAGQRVVISNQILEASKQVILSEISEETQLIEKLPAAMSSAAGLKDFLSKVRWIRALQQRGVTEVSNLDDLELETRHVAPRLQNEIQFRPRTIQKFWRQVANAGGDVRVLMSHMAQRGGKGQTRTCPIGEGFLTEALAGITAEKKRKVFISAISNAVTNSVNQWNRIHPEKIATAPSQQTVSRRVHQAFTSFELACRNKSKTYAQREYRETTPRICGEEALEVAQFDDTDGEVFLIDGVTGLPWGRANLTLGVDEHTAEILGVELSEKPRSTWSALSCLVNAISPKNMSDPMYALCKHPWKAYGVPAQVIMDNALYNHVDQIEATIASVGSIPSWSKPKTPTGKTQVEHLNDVVKTEFTPTLPGWRGPKGDRDGLKEGPHSAVMTTNDYRMFFMQWATDTYPMKARKNGMTPHQGWDADFRLCKPLLPRDPSALKLLCTFEEDLTFRESGGLLRMGLRYQSDALAVLRRRLGSKAKVHIRTHPFDLSKLYVLNPFINCYFIVPCVEHKDYLEGLTEWQQKLILKCCRERGIKNPNLEDLVSGREKLRTLVNQLSTSKKLLHRRTAQRIGDLPKAKPKEPQIVAITALQAAVDAMNEVEIDFSDPGWAIPTTEFL